MELIMHVTWCSYMEIHQYKTVVNVAFDIAPVITISNYRGGAFLQQETRGGER